MNFSGRHSSIQKFVPSLFATFVLLVSLGTTIFLWQQVRLQDATDLQEAFDTAARSASVNIEHKIETFQVVMRGVQGLFGASSDVTYEDFRDYVDALQVTVHLRGVLGVAYVQYLSDEELPGHLTTMRASVSPEMDAPVQRHAGIQGQCDASAEKPARAAQWQSDQHTPESALAAAGQRTCQRGETLPTPVQSGR